MSIESMREVVPMREVPKVPEHCGRPMRKFHGVSSLGKAATVYICAAECGYQEKAIAADG